MCGIPRIRRRPGHDGSAGRFIQDIAAAASMAAGQPWAAPTAATPQWRMMTAARLRPRIVQLCIRCRQNPAGFWVSHTGDQTARRPWRLSCCQALGPSRYHVIGSDGHGGVGRFR